MNLTMAQLGRSMAPGVLKLPSKSNRLKPLFAGGGGNTKKTLSSQYKSGFKAAPQMWQTIKISGGHSRTIHTWNSEFVAFLTEIFQFTSDSHCFSWERELALLLNSRLWP